MKARSFLKLLDFSMDEIMELLLLAEKLKTEKRNCSEYKRLIGKNIAIIFEKDSTRTRCAFEVAAYDQGAHVTYLGLTGSQIGKKESIKDTARVLGSIYDGIEYRGYGQNIVEELAEYAGVPVWNGLTNEFHPTQALADLLTMYEDAGRPLNKLTFCFIGHANNNVANSLLVAAAKMGMDFRAISPSKYAPDKDLVATCLEVASCSGAKITITDNPSEGVKDCDYIYTDVWVSMGESDDIWRERIELLTPFRVTPGLMRATGKPDTKFLHCLPALHNTETAIGMEIFKKYGIECMEVTEDVFESKASIVFRQAENRMHTIKAVMVATLSD